MLIYPIILSLLFRHGFEPDSDSWEYVDTEANARPGDEVEYKVATMQNGLLVESKWTSGIYCNATHVIVVIDGHVAILTCLVFYEVYKQKSTVGFQFLTWFSSLSVLYNRDIARSSPSSLDGKDRAMFKLCQLI